MSNILVLLSHDVPIDDLRIDNLYYYVIEGHGGKSIESWPVYSFFCEYLYGDVDEAYNSFICWYTDQFKKYHNKPKKLGGMHKGSLYQLIEKEYKKKGLQFTLEDDSSLLEQQIFIETIRKRVNQRFDLLDKIRTNGYKLSKADYVKGVKSSNGVILKEGHHRCAALKALGYNSVPNVVVYPGQRFFNLGIKVRGLLKRWSSVRKKNIKVG